VSKVTLSFQKKKRLMWCIGLGVSILISYSILESQVVKKERFVRKTKFKSAKNLNSSYDIVSTANHVGETIESGHYTCTVRHPADGRYYYMNDHEVMREKREHVINEDSYMFFLLRDSGPGAYTDRPLVGKLNRF
jgi:uncharacterized UBP type Zn finger protein